MNERACPAPTSVTVTAQSSIRGHSAPHFHTESNAPYDFVSSRLSELIGVTCSSLSAMLYGFGRGFRSPPLVTGRLHGLTCSLLTWGEVQIEPLFLSDPIEQLLQFGWERAKRRRLPPPLQHHSRHEPTPHLAHRSRPVVPQTRCPFFPSGGEVSCPCLYCGSCSQGNQQEVNAQKISSQCRRNATSARTIASAQPSSVLHCL